jgi:3-methyl-2-oxobutanoate hydroxymethyltransferase
MIGLTKGFKPRFLRQYLNLYEEILNAGKSYLSDVKAGHFPNDEEQY